MTGQDNTFNQTLGALLGLTREQLQELTQMLAVAYINSTPSDTAVVSPTITEQEPS